MPGDAPHRMPPYAGEGVNQAMQDAFELAWNLTSGKPADTQTAIADFEKKIQARSAEVTKRTIENTELMHAPDGHDNLLKIFNEVREE